jgi:hypothetical protein
MRERPAHAPTADLYNPRSRLTGHPLAPFLSVPQPPPASHNLGTPLEHSPSRGLQTRMVLAAPKSTTDLERTAYLSTRLVDSYLLTCQYSTSPPTLPIYGYTEYSSENQLDPRTRCSRPV